MYCFCGNRATTVRKRRNKEGKLFLAWKCDELACEVLSVIEYKRTPGV